MRLQETDIRVSRLRELYQQGGYTSIILTRAANLAWLLGGRVQIGVSGDTGVCKVVVNDDRVVILTNNIEGERLRDEEVGPVPEIITTPWAANQLAAQVQYETAGPNPLMDTACEERMLRLRSVLLPEQETEAEEAALLCSQAMTQACLSVRPGMTEFEISGMLAEKAIAKGLVPIVLFAAVDERICAYRHALSTHKRLEKMAMLSMGAHRNGLFTSITRFVSFGQPSKAILRAQEITCGVAARLYSRTVPGTAYSELFQQFETGYRELGAPEQILLHHQGGLGGFQVREMRLSPDTPGEVLAHQLYAWNPSVTGFKAEDMLLVGEKENRILTNTPEFPHRAFSYGGKTWSLPQILVL